MDFLSMDSGSIYGQRLKSCKIGRYFGANYLKESCLGLKKKGRDKTREPHLT